MLQLSAAVSQTMQEAQNSGFQAINTIAIPIPEQAIADFCDRWKIQEFYFFGSVLRDDFRPDSDIDVMVAFQNNARRGLLALFDMREELEAIFNRPVDLLAKKSVERSENWIRREEILSTAQVIYVAG
jgi:uncharacterized protein